MCPWAAKAQKDTFVSKVVLCMCAEVTLAVLLTICRRELWHRCLLSMVLENWDVFTVGDFADFLDGIGGVEGACNELHAPLHANRVRSDELQLAVGVRATVAADAMSVACASAEL